MIKYQREAAVPALFEEMWPLLKLHFEEISANKDIPLDPDFEQYQKLDELGAIRAFTARDENGLLIGYNVFFVRYNPHYRSSLQALQDVVYIDPTRRGFGAKFILWCDEQLRAEKVQIVMHHVKADPKLNFGPMLERIGYKLVDQIYSRRLD